jgi:hypothetical protein
MQVHDEAIARLRAAGWTAKRIASEIGKPTSYVRNRMIRIGKARRSSAPAPRTPSVIVKRVMPPKTERQNLSKPELLRMLADAVRNTRRVIFFTPLYFVSILSVSRRAENNFSFVLVMWFFSSLVAFACRRRFA